MVRSSQRATQSGGGSTTMVITPTAPTTATTTPQGDTGIRKRSRKSRVAAAAAAADTDNNDDAATTARRQSWQMKAKKAMRRDHQEPSEMLNPHSRIKNLMHKITTHATRSGQPMQIGSGVVAYLLELLDHYGEQILRSAGEVTHNIRHQPTTTETDVQFGIMAANKLCGPRWNGAVFKRRSSATASAH